MNAQEIEQIIEGLTEEEAAELLATEFPEELEKEAAAEAAEYDLQNVLYAYGAMIADLEAATENDEEEFTKEAAAAFEEADTELSLAIEEAIIDSGVDQIEDEVEMHKTAMAAATVIFEGYSDQLEKLAKKGNPGMWKSMTKALKKGYGQAKDKVVAGYKASKKHLQAQGKSYATHGAAGLAGAALLHGANKMQEKQASEMSLDEIAAYTLQKQATVDVVVDGIEKLAARGKGKGNMLAKALKATKKHLKAHGKAYATHGAAAGVGGMGAYLAHRMAKKRGEG